MADLPQGRCQIDLGSGSGAYYIGCLIMKATPKLTAISAKSLTTRGGMVTRFFLE